MYSQTLTVRRFYTISNTRHSYRKYNQKYRHISLHCTRIHIWIVYLSNGTVISRYIVQQFTYVYSVLIQSNSRQPEIVSRFRKWRTQNKLPFPVTGVKLSFSKKKCKYSREPGITAIYLGSKNVRLAVP